LPGLLGATAAGGNPDLLLLQERLLFGTQAGFHSSADPTLVDLLFQPYFGEISLFMISAITPNMHIRIN
jgi:hypothetical protein